MNKTYQKITDTVIDLLKQGICPWRKPWKSAKIAGTSKPLNYQSNRAYSGINHLVLSVISDNPYWLTFNQIKKMGGKLKKGSRGAPVIFWNISKKIDNRTGEEKTVPFLKYYTVFSIADTDIAAEVPDPPAFDFDEVAEAEKIVANWQGKPLVEEIANSGAYYSPGRDRVAMPLRTQFENSNEFYSALFHELGHSTGHATRLNRNLGSKIGSREYALEELTAEMAAAFCCAESGIDNSTIENSAAYLDSWIKVLNEDPKILISAASRAQKAADLILGRVQGQAQEKAA